GRAGGFRERELAEVTPDPGAGQRELGAGDGLLARRLGASLPGVEERRAAPFGEAELGLGGPEPRAARARGVRARPAPERALAPDERRRGEREAERDEGAEAPGERLAPQAPPQRIDERAAARVAERPPRGVGVEVLEQGGDVGVAAAPVLLEAVEDDRL